MAIVDIRDVKYDYVGEESIRLALCGVSLEVERGAFVGILGHNGSGKSTLAKHINALLTPSAGDVFIDGMNTKDESLLYDVRRKAGMVFQNPDNQLVATVVEEDVAFGPENIGLPSAEIRARVDEALATVGMEDAKRRAPHTLSGGQKQRIAIAGVLALSPEIIVFDEPTAMLDPQGREEVLRTIRRLNREDGKTVIYITHFLEEVAEADAVIVVSNGRITLRGTPREVFADSEGLAEAELLPPFASSLYTDIKELLPEGTPCPVSTEELVEALCRLK